MVTRIKKRNLFINTLLSPSYRALIIILTVKPPQVLYKEITLGCRYIRIHGEIFSCYMLLKLLSNQWVHGNLPCTRQFDQCWETELFVSRRKRDLLHSHSTHEHQKTQLFFFFKYSKEHLEAYFFAQFTLLVPPFCVAKLLQVCIISF